jgi:glutamine amidotransferase
MKKICILDYGLGNIKSLYNSLQKIGYKPQFYSENNSTNYDIVFIPGVGSFSEASKLLKNDKLDLFLKEVKKNSYIFGICLGMQILFSKGFENGESKGLDLINGQVKLITSKNKKIILPIVGYKKISIQNNYLKFLKNYDNKKFYFVHSFAGKTNDLKNILCTTKDQNINYCSGVIKERIIGTQFHPEKSGEIGLNFLKDFISSC